MSGKRSSVLQSLAAALDEKDIATPSDVELDSNVSLNQSERSSISNFQANASASVNRASVLLATAKDEAG